VYVITGGLGGIGGVLAHHLAERWQARLVLVGRSGRNRATAAALEVLGAEVMVESVDVTDAAPMAALAARVCARFGAVHGIIHAAGVAGGGLIPLRTDGQVARVMAAKVRGTQVVHSAFAPYRPEFLLLCSSLSAELGGVGQIDYCAANRYLDAFAEAHNSAQTFIQAVNWDTWADAGMAVETELPDALRAEREQALRKGIRSSEGGAALEFVLASASPRIAVSTADLAPRLHRSRQSQPLTAPAPVPARTHPRPSLSCPYVAPRDEAEQRLAAIWSELLGMHPIGIDDNFLECGGHSLLALQLMSRLRQEFRIELPFVAFFEDPTIAALARRLMESMPARAPLVPARAPLIRQARPERLPLSHAQSRLWFLHQLQGPDATYNMPLALRLEGVLDADALGRALGDVVARHESLRTVFPAVDGAPFQQVLAESDARPRFIVTDTSETDLAGQIDEATATPFDLSSEPPIRAWLFRLAPDRHVLLVLLHHIAGDAGSIAPLARDLSNAYRARLRGEALPLDECAIQYADYALWHRTLLGESGDPESLAARQLEFWRSRLVDAPPELRLPFDHERPPVPTFRGGNVGIRLDAALHARLLDLANAAGASLFMVLQAALAALLARLGGGDDVPIGTPVAGRGERALEDAVGFFVNTLVLRIDLAGNPGFRDLLGRVRAFDLDAYQHQDVPFEMVVDALEPSRSLNRHPLFQVMLVLLHQSEQALDLPGVAARAEELRSRIARFDLILGLQERRTPDGQPAGLAGGIEYSLDLFGPRTAEKLAARFVRLLTAAAASPDVPIHCLDILDGDERRLITEVNETTCDVPPQR
jgi:NAD(P)-dependent dehydrogenase (short-subunit alcohol dehydrogenase family)/acyl carrier protein